MNARIEAATNVISKTWLSGQPVSDRETAHAVLAAADEVMFSDGAVENLAARLYDMGEHQNTHTFEAVHDMLTEEARAIIAMLKCGEE